jgi:hypothetical chaperone protein
VEPYSLGIDFGTTNTVLALAGPDGAARLVRFPATEGELFAFRSCLSFYAPADLPSERQISAGPWAIEAYVEDPVETRFIQSFKSFAGQESFRVRDYAGAALGALPSRVVIGRPVRFVGARPSETLALSRYETAFRRLGVEEIRFAYEPVGAAFFFARELDHDATVLVGDFGGGTSDFSIIRFERDADGERRAHALGRSGVGVAGDAFDYRIIDNLVSPALGKGGDYVSFGKTLPIPNKYYAAFARWDQLALLRASREMREIRALAREAKAPERIERLIEVLDENYGYRLYRSVSRLKEALSGRSRAEFRFEAGSISIVRDVDRTEFESWIGPELAQIDGAVDAALADAGLAAHEIDRVFLTGGSSLVPAVRDIFHRRFESGRIETGAELESIASGLALMARERDLDRWTSTPIVDRH